MSRTRAANNLSEVALRAATFAQAQRRKEQATMLPPVIFDPLTALIEWLFG